MDTEKGHNKFSYEHQAEEAGEEKEPRPEYAEEVERAFMGAVNHELNQSLAVISGMAQVIENSLREGEAKERIKEIISQAFEIAEIIKPKIHYSAGRLKDGEAPALERAAQEEKDNFMRKMALALADKIEQRLTAIEENLSLNFSDEDKNSRLGIKNDIEFITEGVASAKNIASRIRSAKHYRTKPYVSGALIVDFDKAIEPED